MAEKDTIHNEVLKEELAKASDKVGELVKGAFRLMDTAYPRWRVHGVQTVFERELHDLINTVADTE